MIPCPGMELKRNILGTDLDILQDKHKESRDFFQIKAHSSEEELLCQKVTRSKWNLGRFYLTSTKTFNHSIKDNGFYLAG
jgi:hypothetical protein